MALPGHQLFGAFANAFWNIAAQESAMIQEELKQTEIRGVELFAQEEIIAQPGIEIFHERACPWRAFHRIDDSVEDALEFATELGS